MSSEQGECAPRGENQEFETDGPPAHCSTRALGCTVHNGMMKTQWPSQLEWYFTDRTPFLLGVLKEAKKKKEVSNMLENNSVLKGVFLSFLLLLSPATLVLADSASDFYQRGLDNALSGNYQEAIKAYNKAIELDPKHAAAYGSRGAAYASIGNYQQAIKDSDSAIELEPRFAPAYYNLGVAYGMLGNHREAIKNFSRAIELNPNHALAYYNRAAAYDELDNHDQAIKDVNNAAKLGLKAAQDYLEAQGTGSQQNTPRKESTRQLGGCICSIDQGKNNLEVLPWNEEQKSWEPQKAKWLSFNEKTKIAAQNEVTIANLKTGKLLRGTRFTGIKEGRPVTEVFRIAKLSEVVNRRAILNYISDQEKLIIERIELKEDPFIGEPLTIKNPDFSHLESQIQKCPCGTLRN